MNKIRNILIVIAVLLQCGALSAICFQREMVLRTGSTVFMRTVPVDQMIPVNAYIPGCPPQPEALIDAVVKVINKLKGK